MSYLITQIILYLIVALLLGLALGWLIWGRRLSQMAEERADMSATIGKLRDQLTECRRDREAREGNVHAPAAIVKPVPAAKTSKPAKGSAFTTDAAKPTGLYASAPQEPADDLKEIKGIGPVMERTLNAHGCYHFKQLAEFTDRDVEWISAAIKTFPDRIKRDRWVEQARYLYLRKQGG